MKMNNPLFSTDSYKPSHFEQYPDGTTDVFSYGEARGTNIPGVNEVVMFGLQKYIKDELLTPITREQVEEAKTFYAEHGVPFNYDGWMRIVERHSGFLPVRIHAVPEGTPVPLSNLMFHVENTDEELPWVTSYVETAILRSVWYGSTVATLSREIKRTIKGYLELTCDNPEAELPFKLHDFGCRGVSSLESAAIGGAAHLINFMGSDTVPGILLAKQYYDAKGMPAFSIPASEHSTMTILGREGEFSQYARMVEKFAKPGKIFACVSDSYDIYNAVRNMWCRGGLLDQVKAAGATVVIRPDSGDPIQTPIEVLDILFEELSTDVTRNKKGYLVLPSYVRVIQGDGIDHADLAAILKEMTVRGYSAENIAFGMGGGLLQKVNRDTFKFAMKASSAIIDGERVDVYKDPVGGGKKSKAGLLDLYYVGERGGPLVTLRDEEIDFRWDGEYRLSDQAPLFLATEAVYRSYGGSLYTQFTTFEAIRERAAL